MLIVFKLYGCFGNGLKMEDVYMFQILSDSFFFLLFSQIEFSRLLLSRYECDQDKILRLNLFLFCVRTQFNLLVS